MKRMISLALAAVMLFTGVYTSGAIAAQAAPATEGRAAAVNTRSDLPSYTQYRKKNGDVSYAKKEIVIDAVSYTSSHNATLETTKRFAGKTGVLKWTNEAGSVSYSFTVPRDGLYTVKFVYYCLPSRNNPVTLGLRVDGKYLFEGMQAFELTRLFADNGDVRVDGVGNELSPEQKEVFKFQEQFMNDTTGLESDPYVLALKAGRHTLTVESQAEPIALDKIVLSSPVQPKTYAELSADYDTSKNAVMEGTILLEGEDADYKNTNALVSQYDQTDPSVHSEKGSNPYLTRINYIGNTQWSSPGQRLTWKFSVPADGYYKIGFRYKQAHVLNGTSYRKLYIDGEIPFKEAKKLTFNYDLDWNYQVFGENADNPYLIYLKKGSHELTMEVSLGALNEVVRDLNDVVYQIGLMYRKIVMITGETPDSNRDYELFTQIPNFLEDLGSYRDELERIAKEIERLAGKKGGTNAASIRTLAKILDNMVKHKFTAHQYLGQYYANYTSVSALVYSMMEMGLDIDYIEIAAPDTALVDPAASWWEKTLYSTQRFLSSFSADYNNVSGDLETEESITIWANWGRDQIRVLNNLIQSSFTKETGIGVNLKMSAASYIQAILSGRGPDCSLHMARSEPVNLALRGAMVDLTQFEDYNEVVKRFVLEDSVVPFTFDRDSTDDQPAGVYALPDTLNFNMMFYRTDIFEEYGLEIPTTWEEYIQVASVLNRNNLQASLPYTQVTSATMINAGVGSLSIYPTMLLQRGASIYNETGTATALTDAEAIKTFEFWTDFFNEYKFPITADFFNRFRIGTMPMGIQAYTMYIQLTMAAPEISGKWKMVPIPGYKQEDGTINNCQAGSGTGCGILRTSHNKEGGWEFLKWWTRADTQLNYSNNCESILGVSGRTATSNPEALKKMAWDKESMKNLLAQWSKIKEVREVPGSYYTARSIDQAYWNVVNSSKNAKDTILKWAEISDNEIERKCKQYDVK